MRSYRFSFMLVVVAGCGSATDSHEGSQASAVVCTAPAPSAAVPTLADNSAIQSPVVYATDPQPYTINALLATYDGVVTAAPILTVNGTDFSCTDQVNVTVNGAVTQIRPSTISATSVQFAMPVSLLAGPATLQVSVNRLTGAQALTPTASNFGPNGFLIQFIGLPNQNYMVQATSDFSSWTPIASVRADASGHFSYTDAAAKSLSLRFYRAIAQASSNAVNLAVVQALSPLTGCSQPGTNCEAKANSISSGGAVGWPGRVTCAKINGGVQCWGDNEFGQLGNGDCGATNPSTCAYSSVPVAVAGLTSGVTALAVGRGHSCAVQNGQVFCWGYDESGEVGSYSEDIRNPQDGVSYSRWPRPVADITNATAVSVGLNHSCALLADGTVKCWGSNQDGILGDGTGVDNFLPVQVLGLSGVLSITSGDYHNCAIVGTSFADGGSVYCWGAPYRDQLGQGPHCDQVGQCFNPGGHLVQNAAFTNAQSISAGGLHTCALQGGAVYCWGDDVNGELGQMVAAGHTPQAKSAIASNVTAIAVGPTNSCAIFRGAVNCWGKNDAGQLGDLSAVISGQFYTPAPTPLAGVSGPVDDFAIGSDHGCLMVQGAIKCWGAYGVNADNAGELGNSAVSSPCPGNVCLPVQVWGLQGQVSETVQLAQNAYTVAPGPSVLSVVVNRTGLGVPTTVQYATSDKEAVAGTDYTATSGTLSFAQNELTKTINISVNNASLGDKRFLLSLFNPSANAGIGINFAAVVTLTTPAYIQFTGGAFPGPNSASTAALSLSRSVNTTGANQVHWAVRGGGASGNITFNAGDTTAGFTVPITHQANPSYVYVDLSAPTSGALLGLASAVITVDGLGTVEFTTLGPLEIPTGTNTATLTIMRPIATGTAMTVHYKTVNGSGGSGGVAPTDFTAVDTTFTWAANDSTLTKDITINVIHNTGKLFSVQIYQVDGGFIGAPSSESVLIDGLPTIGFSGAIATSGFSVPRQGETAQIPVLRSTTVGTSTVSYAITTPKTAISPADFSGATSGTLTFAAGVGAAYINVPITNWTTATACSSGVPATHTFTVALSNPSNALIGFGTATVYIDAMSGVAYASGTDNVSPSGSTFTRTYIRSAPYAGPLSIHVHGTACAYPYCDPSESFFWKSFSVTLNWADGESGTKTASFGGGITFANASVNNESADSLTAGGYYATYNPGTGVFSPSACSPFIQ